MDEIKGFEDIPIGMKLGPEEIDLYRDSQVGFRIILVDMMKVVTAY